MDGIRNATDQSFRMVKLETKEGKVHYLPWDSLYAFKNSDSDVMVTLVDKPGSTDRQRSKVNVNDIVKVF